jgi:serine/threonine protein kinase
LLAWLTIPLRLAQGGITFSGKISFCDRMAVRLGTRIEITNPNFSSGGEGWVAEGLRDGKESIAIKVFFPERKSAESVRAEVRNLNKVLREGGERAKQFFVPYELVELEKDGSSPVLISPIIEWEPGSKRKAPTLLECLNNNFRDFEGTEEQRTALRVSVFYQLAEAASYISNARISHRDLNYKNILVTKKGQIKILDWGVSARYGEQPIISDEGSAFIAGHRLFFGPGQATAQFASPRDDVEILRRMAWFVFSPEDFRSKNLIAGPSYVDYAGAPEVPGISPCIPIAAWSRIPNTPHEYHDLLNQAKTMPVDKFLPFYTRKLIEADPKKGGPSMFTAQGILDSPTLIQNFPDGLGITSSERDAIIKGAIALYGATHDPRTGAPRPPGSGAHGFQYYDQFFDRIEQLQNDKKLTKRYDLPGRPPNQRRLRIGLPPFRWVPGENFE